MDAVGEENPAELQYGYFSSISNVLIYKYWKSIMRQRNQPALAKLSPTAALVPGLSHDKVDKDPTGGKNCVIFILKSWHGSPSSSIVTPFLLQVASGCLDKDDIS